VKFSSSRTPSIRGRRLNAFCLRVTRVAPNSAPKATRRSGRGPEVAGTWKDLTDNVNFQASNLNRAGPKQSPDVGDEIAAATFRTKITVARPRRILLPQGYLEPMVEAVRPVAAELTARCSRVGTEGTPRRPGRGARRRLHLEGFSPTTSNLLAAHRPPMSAPSRSHHRRGARRPVAQDHVDLQGLDSRAEKPHQHQVEPLNAFAGRVTLVAREVAPEGKLVASQVLRRGPAPGRI